MTRREMLEQYKGKILPPNHPLTKTVKEIATRLLEANNLGTLGTPNARTVMAQHEEDLWYSDATHGARTEDVVPEAGGTQWELMVVDDDKVVNAQAAFGQC